MNERVPSRQTALKLLKDSGCSQNVVDHCESVARLAICIAKEMRNSEPEVDLQLVEIGALLHDIGRSRTHGVDHGLVGASIAEDLGLPRSIVSIIKRHIGGGISKEEARKLGWPDDIYVPVTLEEKIVCYADKRIAGSKMITLEQTMKEYGKVSHAAIERIMNLHMEITKLTGDNLCLK